MEIKLINGATYKSKLPRSYNVNGERKKNAASHSKNVIIVYRYIATVVSFTFSLWLAANGDQLSQYGDGEYD